MRSREFLSEGSLSRADFKERYRLANFITKLEKKEPFIAVSGDPIVIPASSTEIKHLKAELKNSFDPADPRPKAQSIKPVDIPNTIGGIKLSSLQKTREFGGTFSVNSSGEMDVSKANIGPTVEALKAFAIYAKLVMRGKDQITPEDVIAIGQLAASNSKVEAVGGSKSPTTVAFYSRNVPDVGKKINDQIALKIALSTPSFLRAVRTTQADKEAWGNLQGIIKYVNTESDMGKYSRYFGNNNHRDPLKIAVVGIEQGKVDIEATLTTDTGEEKPIQNLNLSVKANDAPWFDQATANNADGMVKFYNIIGLGEDAANQAMITANFQPHVKSSTPKEFEKRIKAATLIYEVAFNQLKAKIPESIPGEARYIQTFLANLKNSLAGDQKLVYVKFDAKGTYEKLKPHLLIKLAEVIDLDVNFSADPGRPTIYWIDKATGRTLVYVVLLKVPSEKRLTHQFNLGKDFFPLLREAEKLLNTPTAVPANAPVTTPGAATTPKSIQNMQKPLGTSQQMMGQEPAQAPPQ
jgi:hypothetical protein